MNSKNDKAPNKYLAPKHMHRLEPFSTHRCATTAASSGDGFGEAASPLPEIHQPDRGRQYCSHVYVEHLLDIGTCVSISTPGQPTQTPSRICIMPNVSFRLWTTCLPTSLS